MEEISWKNIPFLSWTHHSISYCCSAQDSEHIVGYSTNVVIIMAPCGSHAKEVPVWGVLKIVYVYFVSFSSLKWKVWMTLFPMQYAIVIILRNGYLEALFDILHNMVGELMYDYVWLQVLDVRKQRRVEINEYPYSLLPWDA